MAIPKRTLRSDSVPDLVARFREAAVHRGAAFDALKTTQANRHFEDMMAIRNELATRGEVAALSGILLDEQPWVQLSVACALLESMPAQAEAILRQLAEGKGRVAIQAEANLIAKYGFKS